MFLPSASLYASTTTVPTSAAPPKIATIPIHAGRVRYLLVVYFSTKFHCAVSGILNPFNTSSASRHCVFTCSLYVYIYTMIHAMEFGKPGTCPSYTENTYISVIGDIQTKL